MHGMKNVKFDHGVLWEYKYHGGAIPRFMTCFPKVIFNNFLPSASSFFKWTFSKMFPH